MIKKTIQDAIGSVFTPNEASMIAYERAESIKESKDRGVSLPLEVIKDYFAPVLPGQIVAVIAQSTNYKSGFINWWESALAKQLMDENRDEVIVHISTEDLVEEQIWFELGKEAGLDANEIARGEVVDWEEIQRAVMKVGTIPIYRIGDSLSVVNMTNDLYLSNIIRALQGLQDGAVTGSPVKIAAVFLDYLQALPFDPETRKIGGGTDNMRRLQVKDDIYRIRKGAKFFNCPWIIGVQAKQHLSGALDDDFLLPGLYDGEESSAIGQHADRIITLWMPKTTHISGGTLDFNGIRFPVEPNVLWLKVAKQRGRLPSGGVWMERINFINNTLTLDKSIGMMVPITNAPSVKKKSFTDIEV